MEWMGDSASTGTGAIRCPTCIRLYDQGPIQFPHRGRGAMSSPDSAQDTAPAVARFSLPAKGPAPSRGSMPEAVASALREAILDGALTPGTWLREAEVAREMKVSRTPVRDAFRILASEGL